MRGTAASTIIAIRRRCRAGAAALESGHAETCSQDACNTYRCGISDALQSEGEGTCPLDPILGHSASPWVPPRMRGPGDWSPGLLCSRIVASVFRPPASVHQVGPPSDSFGTDFQAFDSHESLFSRGARPSDCSSACASLYQREFGKLWPRTAAAVCASSLMPSDM